MDGACLLEVLIDIPPHAHHLVGYAVASNARTDTDADAKVLRPHADCGAEQHGGGDLEDDEHA